MTDAELMTTDATVPGLEVKDNGVVKLEGLPIGCVTEYVFKTGFFASSQTADSPDFPTRNEAVKWILDQHKAKGEK